MYVSHFELKNYKSYAQTGELRLESGFNIITGPNNVGKTALLEALSLHFTGKPHRSLRSLPFPDSQPLPTSEGIVRLSISGDELKQLLYLPNSRFFVPVPDPSSDLSRDIGFNQNTGDGIDDLLKWLISPWRLHTFEYKIVCNPGQVAAFEPNRFPSLLDFEVERGSSFLSTNRFYVPFVVGADGVATSEPITGSNESMDFGRSISGRLHQRVYYFHAQRLNVGKCAFGTNPNLAPNAQNLPEVLNILQNNPNRFGKFNELVSQIIPQVKWVSVRPSDSGTVEIVVWNHDPQTQREDLAFPLDESGTGIGQVLAILYVVLTSSMARTIIIDEPQSFLHRGAARKLIEILKAYPKHQYIIATHSPTIITATNPSTITLVRQQDGESNTRMLTTYAIENQRLCLAEVGATSADVFGYDNILWVEGETEERCFPAVLEKVAKRSLMGTAIRRVKHTGDFEAKDANVIFDIYDRLSYGNSLLPPAIGFLFDDECRHEKDKEEMQRRGKNKVCFLPRRMYENYLLNADAIASVINATIRETGNRGAQQVTIEDVQKLLESKLRDRKYFKHAEDKTGKEDCIAYVHGADVLADLFSELSREKGPVAFDKVRHAIALTDHIVSYNREDLREVANVIESALDSRPMTIVKTATTILAKAQTADAT